MNPPAFGLKPPGLDLNPPGFEFEPPGFGLWPSPSALGLNPPGRGLKPPGFAPAGGRAPDRDAPPGLAPNFAPPAPNPGLDPNFAPGLGLNLAPGRAPGLGPDSPPKFALGPESSSISIRRAGRSLGLELKSGFAPNLGLAPNPGLCPDAGREPPPNAGLPPVSRREPSTPLPKRGAEDGGREPAALRAGRSKRGRTEPLVRVSRRGRKSSRGEASSRLGRSICGRSNRGVPVLLESELRNSGRRASGEVGVNFGPVGSPSLRCHPGRAPRSSLGRYGRPDFAARFCSRASVESPASFGSISVVFRRRGFSLPATVSRSACTSPGSSSRTLPGSTSSASGP